MSRSGRTGASGMERRADHDEDGDVRAGDIQGAALPPSDVLAVTRQE